jgi:hypothetical protein
MPGSFAAFALAPHGDKDHLYFSSIPFSDPMMIMSPNTVFAGVPVGRAKWLPEGSYVPKIALANFGSRPVHVRVGYTSTAMTTFFIIYAIYALIALVSCSCANAASPVQYVGISKSVLEKWIISGRRPIVLEVCGQRPNDAGSHACDSPLIVAQKELVSLIHWLPPSSLLVIQSPTVSRWQLEVEERRS